MEARYDEIAEFYTGQVSDIDPATAAVLALAGDVAGARLLDVACGAGRLSRELARRGADVTGVDISARMVALAGTASEVAYVVGDIATVAVGAGYDGVVCNWGLSDIDDLDGALDAVVRALRPGGFFACCILHPCFPGLDAAQIASSWPPGGYFTEGWWATVAARSGIRRRVGANHRTLATYLNALTGRGLAVTEVREPEPPAPWLAGAVPVPTYLALRCVRSGG
jgi:SAM-dependent methyltransferase